MNALATILGGIALLIGLTLLFAVPTMLLWDWLMPELFGLKEITLIQAWGVNFLCGMLFKNNTSNSK
jgi:hypothetical protein